MNSRIHDVTQHRVGVARVEAMTLVSNHHFPRHAHDQFGMGLIAFGAQKSWSGVGAVNAEAGNMVMQTRAKFTTVFRSPEKRAGGESFILIRR